MLSQSLDLFLHLDKHLNVWAGMLGPWLYAVLFAIIFCETGLVVTPYLPGDSLLFAVGALAAADASPIRLPLAALLLCAAAVLGDTVNYAAGAYAGPRVFSREDSPWLSKKHLLRAHAFYEKYGGKTILLARFIPIIRTFAPFVAGIGTMRYARFAVYNIAGGVLWTCLLLFGGFYFAALPVVKRHFSYVELAIIGISILPIFVELLRARHQPNPA